jgi:hypothetical protein
LHGGIDSQSRGRDNMACGYRTSGSSARHPKDSEAKRPELHLAAWMLICVVNELL